MGLWSEAQSGGGEDIYNLHSLSIWFDILGIFNGSVLCFFLSKNKEDLPALAWVEMLFDKTKRFLP